MAQISMNLDDYKITNLHHVYEECEKDARELHVSLCGSQIVGLLPLDSLLMAADYYIQKEKLLILDEEKKVKLAMQRLGLNSVFPFNPKERVIEYIIKDRLTKEDGSEDTKYQSMSIRNFVDLIGARSSLPGGGCVAALVAALGSSLANMAAYLTYGNRKFEKHDTQIRELLPPFYTAYNDLMSLIDQDALAFNAYVESRRLPDKSEEEKSRFLYFSNVFVFSFNKNKNNKIIILEKKKQSRMR